MKTKTVHASWATMALAAILTGNGAQAKIIATGNYESGTYSGCGKLVTSPVRAGKYACRIGLTARPTSEANMRCENPFSGGRVGSEFWYGTSFYFPPDWPAIVQPDARVPGYCISQWINWKGNGCFPFCFQLQISGGDKFAIFYYCNDKPSYTQIASMKKGSWHDFVVHAKWSLTSSNVEVFLNKQRVWSYNGCIGENCDGPTPSLQYRASLYSQHHYGPERYLIHDEYKMGDASSSMAEVSPGSTPTDIVRLTPVQPGSALYSWSTVLGAVAPQALSIDGRSIAARGTTGGPSVPRRVLVLRKSALRSDLILRTRREAEGIWAPHRGRRRPSSRLPSGRYRTALCASRTLGTGPAVLRHQGAPSVLPGAWGPQSSRHSL